MFFRQSCDGLRPPKGMKNAFRSATALHESVRGSSSWLRRCRLSQPAGCLVDVVDKYAVALELHLVVIPSRALHVTATVRIGVMCQLDAFRRALQSGFGLNEFSLGVSHGLVGVGQGFHFRRRQLLGPVRSSTG